MTDPADAAAPAPGPKFRELRSKLWELFQVDRQDLDFGIYRVLNLRRAEIAGFLENDLLGQVRGALGALDQAGRKELQAELDKMVQQLKAAKVDPDSSPAVLELRAKLSALPDARAAEEDVYGHLYAFFARYYEDGDFLSRRVYRPGTYAIPYEGQEVKLHWANADQYYVKTTERFATYAFKLPEGGPRIRFELVAATTARDNAKDNKRRYCLASEDAVAADAGELIVRFEYRTDEDSQKKVNERTVETLLAHPGFKPHAIVLQSPPSHLKDRDDPPGLLAHHLKVYTERNSFDYFIHKDLEAFLTRELDWYVKTVILDLDDLLAGDGAKTAAIAAQAGAVRAIGQKIAKFLARIEDFQKRLWLKRKFVVGTSWCVTLDRIPAKFHAEIAANDAQREAWVKLFRIDLLKKDLAGQVGYSKKLTPEFLAANPHLSVDTALFDKDFEDRLLAEIDGLDDATTGLAIKGENFQALRLIEARFAGQVPCIYIDPPYNTGGDGFLYRDSYQHSSWLAMMRDRLEAARRLMNDESSIFCSIDDNEVAHARLVFDETFGEANFVATMIWQKKYAPANDAKWLSDDHDYILNYARDKDTWRPKKLPRTDEQNAAYSNPDGDPRGAWKASDYTSNKSATDRPNLNYAIKHPTTGADVWPPEKGVWRYSQETYQEHLADDRIWWGSDKANSMPAYKRFLKEVDDVVPRTILLFKEVGHTQDAVRDLRALLPETDFTSPKAIGVIERVCRIGGDTGVFDFFGGSGTSGHAVIRMNRADQGQRRYMLVEQGPYFDTVLKPRLLKAAYAGDWNDGVPERGQGLSHILKIVRLESYEDALDNVAFKDPDPDAAPLLANNKAFKEGYTLAYGFAREAEGSPALPDSAIFAEPFEVRMAIQDGDARKEVRVDLPETFNYLIGLKVLSRRRYAKFGDLLVFEGVTHDASGREEKTLVVWRSLSKTPSAKLEDFFRRLDLKTKDTEFATIYVNGDNNLENIRREDETWKVRLIDAVFLDKMYAGD